MAGPSSRILKKGSPAASAALTGAEEVLAAAQARARDVVAAAEAEAARLRAAASEEAGGLRAVAAAEGHAEGRARAAATIARAAAVREEQLARLDGAVVEAAIEVARRILGRELSTVPAVAADVARRALRAAAGCGDVVLRVAPADLSAVRDAEDALRTLVERGALALMEDASLGRGEVVVEAAGGRVDARIEAQLEAFRRALGEDGA